MNISAFSAIWRRALAAALIVFAGATAHAAAPEPTHSAPVFKLAIDKGVTLDEAAESMRLRGNALNLKLVGELPLSAQVEAITGKPQRRMAIFQFCDALTAKDLIDLDIEFVVYMPCRIALVEDAKGQGWLLMTDIDVDAMAREKHVPPELKKRMQNVRSMLVEIMKAGAKGDI
jgi:uncharacterized protein (DUF302 family)